MITVIDYDAGNIRSVMNALNRIGRKARLTDDGAEAEKAGFVLLPGVGSFGHAMHNLKARGLDRALKYRFEKDMPTLGICLGLQLMFERSEESPNEKGLGFFKGSVKKLGCEGMRVPHIGWTTIETNFPDWKRFDGEYFYFVHSYAVHAEDESIVSAHAEYGERFAAAVSRGNTAACQFHPEKSGAVGLKLLEKLTDFGGNNER